MKHENLVIKQVDKSRITTVKDLESCGCQTGTHTKFALFFSHRNYSVLRWTNSRYLSV